MFFVENDENNFQEAKMKRSDQLTISGNKKKSQRRGGITMGRLQSKMFVVGAAILMQLLGVLTFAATVFAQELFWVKSPGTGNAQGFGVAVDASGNSYVTGTYSGTLTFAPGVTLPFAPAGANDIFVAKYDTTGTAMWATRAGGQAMTQGGP